MTTEEIVAKLQHHERVLMDIGLLEVSRQAVSRLLVLERAIEGFKLEEQEWADQAKGMIARAAELEAKVAKLEMVQKSAQSLRGIYDTLGRRAGIPEAGRLHGIPEDLREALMEALAVASGWALDPEDAKTYADARALLEMAGEAIGYWSLKRHADAMADWLNGSDAAVCPVYAYRAEFPEEKIDAQETTKEPVQTAREGFEAYWQQLELGERVYDNAGNWRSHKDTARAAYEAGQLTGIPGELRETLIEMAGEAIDAMRAGNAAYAAWQGATAKAENAARNWQRYADARKRLEEL